MLADGYKWTGTSSTYGDLRESEPREIIPWSLVERKDAAQTGWYAGIEFSGRTRISMAREKDSLQVAIGLNPDPSPFRTRLTPGEVFETPVVFLGGFRDGPDGAGNVLRRWVRAVLGNPETWKNPNYPLVVNNSWGGGMDVNEEIALRMIRDSAELGRGHVPRRRRLVSRRRRLVSQSAEIPSRSCRHRRRCSQTWVEIRSLGGLDASRACPPSPEP